jgi:hypothetical protein
MCASELFISELITKARNQKSRTMRKPHRSVIPIKQMAVTAGKKAKLQEEQNDISPNQHLGYKRCNQLNQAACSAFVVSSSHPEKEGQHNLNQETMSNTMPSGKRGACLCNT